MSIAMYSLASPPMATNPGMTQWNTAPRYVRRFPLWPRPGQTKKKKNNANFLKRSKNVSSQIFPCVQMLRVSMFICLLKKYLSIYLSIYLSSLYLTNTILGFFWPLHNSTTFLWPNCPPIIKPLHPTIGEAFHTKRQDRRPAHRTLPFSPVQRQRKFSQVSGTTSPNPPLLATQQRNFKDHHACCSDVPYWYGQDANGTTLGRSKNHCFTTMRLSSFIS